MLWDLLVAVIIFVVPFKYCQLHQCRDWVGRSLNLDLKASSMTKWRFDLKGRWWYGGHMVPLFYRPFSSHSWSSALSCRRPGVFIGKVKSQPIISTQLPITYSLLTINKFLTNENASAIYSIKLSLGNSWLVTKKSLLPSWAHRTDRFQHGLGIKQNLFSLEKNVGISLTTSTPSWHLEFK